MASPFSQMLRPVVQGGSIQMAGLNRLQPRIAMSPKPMARPMMQGQQNMAQGRPRGDILRPNPIPQGPKRGMFANLLSGDDFGGNLPMQNAYAGVPVPGMGGGAYNGVPVPGMQNLQQQMRPEDLEMLMAMLQQGGGKIR